MLMQRRLRSLASACGISLVLAAVAAGSSGTFHAQARQPAATSRLRFDVSFIPQIHDGPITGRAFVMVTRSIDKVPEPRLQIGRTGIPFFGRDVERLEPEKIVTIDAGDLGTPLDSIADIPAADYFVQAVVVVYVQKNWATVGPKLVDKLFFYTGDVDTYYLNNSTRELEKWMKTTTSSHYEGFFMYGNNKPHCWSGPVSPAERLKEIAQFIQRKRPEGATTSWWAY